MSVYLVDDSFAALARGHAGTFDVAITDPPYDAHVHDNIVSGTAMRDHVRGGSGGVPKVDLPFDPLADYKWSLDLVRVVRRWALVFCAVEAFGDLRRLHGDAYRRGAFWYKPNSQGQMTGDRPAQAGEGIACLHAGKPRWNGRGSYGFWPCNSTRGEQGRHPNQKPLDLCLKLVALFSDRGETVFDPFAGSGRIGEACAMLGRGYVGFERDPAWVDRANARLEAVTSTMSDAEALALCTAKKSEIVQ